MLSSMSSVLERERAELRRMAEERFAELEIVAKPRKYTVRVASGYIDALAIQ